MRVLLVRSIAIGIALGAIDCGSDPVDPGRGSFDGGLFVPGTGGDSSAGLGNIEAVITTDNAFSFGYGDQATIATFIAGGPASNGSEIFDCPVNYGPHAFVVPEKDAPSSAYLYIVAWADTKTTQGVLAQFKRTGGQVLYSGSGSWQVCATGQFIDITGAGPDQALANQYIEQCNVGAAGNTYSKGWVTTAGPLTGGAVGRLAFGEANDDGAGSFPIVCHVDDAGVRGIDPQATWMWFDPLDGQSPFEGNDGNRTKTFLLFRLPASALVVK